MTAMDDRSRTLSAYNRWAASYDADPNPQTRLEFDAVVNAVAAAKGDRILDAGCGTGRYAVVFHRAGAEVVGIDFSEAMLARAKAKLPTVRFDVADLTAALPFADRKFNKICCAQTLKHIPNLRPTVQEFSRILEPDGLLVFSVTHPDMVWDGYAMRTPPEFILSQEADIHHHTWATYQDALNASGFHSVMRQDVRVTELISSLLTAESFGRVVGRTQVLVCSARKPPAGTV